MMGIVIAWLIFSVIAGLIAAAKGRSGPGYFVLSVFLTPLVGVAAALAVSNVSKSERPQKHLVANMTPRANDGQSGDLVEIRVVTGRSSGPLRGKTSKSKDCWVPPGKRTNVRGFEILDGMIYVGRALPAVEEWVGVEPALIDPTLNTAKESSKKGEGMGYWPSYSAIPESCRTAYLEWLAGGRKDPSAYIGYVFLFVYGLERRLLADYPQHTAVKNEVPQLIAELDRLLALYGAGSFGNYVGSLLEFLAAREYIEHGTPPKFPTDRSGFEAPLSIRIAVGSRAVRNEPLETELALAWVRTDPQIPLRTPATRCADEFEKLFAIEYEQAHGLGLKLPQCKRRVSASYRPASASFGQTLDLKFDLPDVTSLVGPRTQLQDIVTNCTEALDSYSRLIGRQPEGRGSVAAAALLPDKLLHLHPPQNLQDLRVRVEGKLGKQGMVIVPAADVLRPWLPQDGSPQKKRDAVEASRFLERIGFGMEPDVRFGGGRIACSDEIALFRLSGEEQHAPSRAYTAAATLLGLAVAVAMADGELSREEAGELRVHVSNALYLEASERLRLVALLEWFARNPPKLPAAKKMATVDEASRRTAARFLVQVASVDGSVSPVEVRTLARIYSLLELDPHLVHADLHSALGPSISADDPVTVVPAGKVASGYRVPRPEDIQPRKPKITLSADEIARKQNEAAAVARLLGTVFVDEGVVSASTTPAGATSTATRTYGALDASHSRLLEHVGTNEKWSVAEFERLVVDECKLLIDGAIETLNECAIETCDEPLLEMGDSFRVNMDVYREMVK
jgi:tellurite resistance protein